MIVQFVCEQGIARSQIAGALFNDPIHETRSTGIVPGWYEGKTLSKIGATSLLESMSLFGYDISNKVVRRLTNDAIKRAGLLVVMGQKSTWPYYLIKAAANGKVIHWEIQDPVGYTREEYIWLINGMREELQRLKGMLEERLKLVYS